MHLPTCEVDALHKRPGRPGPVGKRPCDVAVAIKYKQAQHTNEYAPVSNSRTQKNAEMGCGVERTTGWISYSISKEICF